MTARAYIGRFAPSPTGPLHFGSLLAAVASYLDAKSANGTWIVRIEDIDPPREPKGSAQQILDALEAYGFEWDGSTQFQSCSAMHHENAIAQLREAGLTYHCDCSRRSLASAKNGALGKIYPSTCRKRTVSGESALRVKVDGETRFEDRLQGAQCMQLVSESGDFVIRRRDGLVAYHLAVVVDDILANVTDIVRGIDLMPSTHRQIYLQNKLSATVPRYAHIPVAVHENGDKLSKLTGARALTMEHPERLLVDALRVLRQAPPAELDYASLTEVWDWALSHWQIQQLKGLVAFESHEKKC